jgi:hypothetical protein
VPTFDVLYPITLSAVDKGTVLLRLAAGHFSNNQGGHIKGFGGVLATQLELNAACNQRISDFCARSPDKPICSAPGKLLRSPCRHNQHKYTRPVIYGASQDGCDAVRDPQCVVLRPAVAGKH